MKRIIPVLILAALIAGCSSRPSLTVSSRDQHKLYEQTFTQVYASRSHDGDYDIVLMDNPIDDVKASAPGKPLKAQPVRPLRHLVHIHVMWTPMTGAMGDNPSATNAAINWYVWGDATSQEADLMHYGGTGFVKVYAGDDSADFSVSNAVLKLKAQRGKMIDPVGTASVEGKFEAPLSTKHVQQLLAQLDAETGGTRLTRMDGFSPPARTVEP